MFELTIESNYLHEDAVLAAKNFLLPTVQDMGGVIVCGNTHGRIQIALAVPISKKHVIKSIVLDVAADAIVSIFKRQHLDDAIHGAFLSSETRSSLLSALSEFDRETDVNLAKKHLVFSNCILLDSTYFFKMQELRDRWDEVAVLVSNNLPNLIAGDAVIEMMKFLIKTTPSKTPEVYLSLLDDGKLSVVSKNPQRSCLQLFDKTSEDFEEKFISFLISLAPKRIFVTHKLKSCLSCMEKIQNLFEDKIFTT
ncbi:MAG: hypothetical protein IJW24_00665 [Clostridia bacterium]|nr:hypothetical protein [Clostridia bacterium]